MAPFISGPSSSVWVGGSGHIVAIFVSCSGGLEEVVSIYLLLLCGLFWWADSGGFENTLYGSMEANHFFVFVQKLARAACAVMYLIAYC